jgi:predicted ATPase/DNA-binding SARP family transcriptional activator
MGTSTAAEEILQFYLLGSPEVRRGSIILPPLPTQKTTSLLAYLLLHKHFSHSREKLAELFWGDVSDEQARHSLRTALATLRRELGSDLFLTDRESIQVSPDFSIWVDALEFEKQARSATDLDIATLQSTISLYRGDLLPDFYDDWILRERDRYQTLYLVLLLQMTQLLRARSDYARAIEYAERALECEPANERAHQHLIFCHLANGDRSAALRQYEACCRTLQEELAVEPSPETTALYNWLTRAPTKALEARITNLPIPISSYIGRVREMARVKEMLAQARLATLTGPGGCGKTRLAIQAASDLVDSFRDGVWWVDFAPLTDASLVSQAVAKAMGFQEVPGVPIEETILHLLRPRMVLLVLDNCEHLVDEIARLAMALLNECPALKILATSREALGILGEMILLVPPLSFPLAGQFLPGEKAKDYESVRLLCERATAVKPNFGLSEGNTSAVAQICFQLDGMPLAIELAAACIKAMPVSEIAERLNDRFRLLTAGSRTALHRHQTLRAVIDWSYSLLPEKERSLLMRLSTFVGGWTLAAAEAVSSDGISSHEVFELMARLVDKSLVETSEEPGGGARYRMLETVRQYGLERLSEAGQVGATRHRHALFFAGLAERAEPQLRGPEVRAWLARLETEHDNFRSALDWSLAHGSAELCLRFAGALGIFWHRGYLSEGGAWLERLLERGKEAPPRLRVKAMASASWLARDLGEYRRATGLQEESAEILRAVGDKLGLFDVLIGRGLLAVYQNDPQRAFANFGEALALAEELGHRWGRARALVNLAHAALFNLQWDAEARSRCEEALELFRQLDDATEQAHALIILGPGAHYEGDDQRGRRLVEQGVAICRQAGDRRQLAWATSVLGVMLRWEGRVDEALPIAKEGLRLAQELGEKTIEVFALVLLAGLAKDRGKTLQSLHLLGCAITYGESFGYRASRLQWDVIIRDVDAMRSELGEEAFTRAWAYGVGMPPAWAVQAALDDS